MNTLLMSLPNRSYVIMPSLGLGYLASVARKANHQIKILNCLNEKMDIIKFKKYILKNNFDVIGMQLFTFDLQNAKKFLRLIKEVKPETITIVGGYHPSGAREEVLNELKDADFAFYAEAEIGFVELLNKLHKKDKNNDFSSVPNLIWRKNGKIILNPLKVVENLDSLPFPAWDLMNPQTYPEAPHGGFAKSFPTAPLVITRGCPMECTFCAGKSVTTNKIRKRSIPNVIREIKYLKQNYGVKDFLIEDENFTVHKDLVHEFCNTLLKENIKINWSCPSGVRIDSLDLETLILMKKSGCHYLSLGIEFGSQRIHDLTKKHLSLKIIKSKAGLFKKAGIITTGFFLMGIPGETKKEMIQTIKFAKTLPIDFAQFNNFMPLPGSEVYKEMQAKGELGKINTNKFFVHDVAYVPKGMTQKEMKNLQRKAYIEFYLRPLKIITILNQIKSPKHWFFLMKRFFDAVS